MRGVLLNPVLEDMAWRYFQGTNFEVQMLEEVCPSLQVLEVPSLSLQIKIFGTVS